MLSASAAVAEGQAELAVRLGGRGLFDLERGTVVVLPSLSFPEAELRKITGIEHYEERLLCLALMLRQEGLRVVYLTSCPVDPAIVEYHLALCPDPGQARQRLHLLALDDPAPRPLTVKLLERPDVLARVRELTRGQDAFLVPFNVTAAEGRAAEVLDLPLYGCRPDLVELGSKTGSRRVAREAGVEVPDGAEGLTSLAMVERAASSLQAEGGVRPGGAVDTAVIKLNNGFSGQGNALVDLSNQAEGDLSTSTTFCASEESWPSFAAKIEAEGAVVEAVIRHPGLTSPSVQLHVVPGGSLEVVSTHDQVLGGPDNQVYLGCRYPASAAYREDIVAAALRVGRVLADRGVIGPFGIDFLATADRRVWLSEINMRMGGTTHPFQMARLVTGGPFRTYVASDNLKDPAWAGLSPAAVINALERRALAWDQRRGSGATLHLLGALRSYGKLGCTCIADSLEEAEQLRDEVTAAVDALAAGSG